MTESLLFHCYSTLKAPEGGLSLSPKKVKFGSSTQVLSLLFYQIRALKNKNQKLLFIITLFHKRKDFLTYQIGGPNLWRQTFKLNKLSFQKTHFMSLLFFLLLTGKHFGMILQCPQFNLWSFCALSFSFIHACIIPSSNTANWAPPGHKHHSHDIHLTCPPSTNLLLIG